ncbi:hypothetical protein CEXT_652491 [Caerostris extrusa]|uniref:Uncharacterized protein n=1 Tax=Caerostris extrusa TaxID=172846 RepID=A0AAV4SNE9_CAEEX|nr:hypothetical protein CEXT_652491 [Caerostris extrusa]
MSGDYNIKPLLSFTIQEDPTVKFELVKRVAEDTVVKKKSKEWYSPNLLAYLSDQESKLPTKVRGRRTTSQKKLMRLQKELSSRFEKSESPPELFTKDKVSVIMKKTKKTIKSIDEDDLEIILHVLIEGLLYELVATTNSTIENWIFVFCYKL